MPNVTVKLKEDRSPPDVFIDGEGPLEFLAGSARFVYIWGPFVVKIGLEGFFADAMKQNVIEHLTFKESSPAIRRFLAESFEYGFGLASDESPYSPPCRFSWHIQERIEGLKLFAEYFDSSTEAIPAGSLHIRDMLLYGSRGAIKDLHEHNIGFRSDGRIVVFDYGFRGYDKNIAFLNERGISV